RFVDWEKYSFILCDHHELRRIVYAHRAGEESQLSKEELENRLHGKYVSPADLRSSPGFIKLVDEAQEIRGKYRDTDFNKVATLLQRKAEEVAGRLSAFDGVSQNSPVIQGKKRTKAPVDPVGVVALDQVPGGAWFSAGSLRAIQHDAKAWQNIMRDRLGQEPQRYIKPERMQELRQFQEQVKAGRTKADKDLKELEEALRQGRDDKVTAFEERHKGTPLVEGSDLIRDEIFSGMDQPEQVRLGDWIRAHNEVKDKAEGEIKVSV